MATHTDQVDKCDNCGKLYENGGGISGYTVDGNRKDYDFECAFALQLAVNENGDLLPYQEVFPN